MCHYIYVSLHLSNIQYIMKKLVFIKKFHLLNHSLLSKTEKSNPWYLYGFIQAVTFNGFETISFCGTVFDEDKKIICSITQGIQWLEYFNYHISSSVLSNPPMQTAFGIEIFRVNFFIVLGLGSIFSHLFQVILLMK